MAGAMEAKIIFLPNIKTMILKLMQSGLANMMKSKVMKKNNNLPVENFQRFPVEQGGFKTRICYRISHQILEHVCNIDGLFFHVCMCTLFRL